MQIKDHKVRISPGMAKSFESKTWLCNTLYAKEKYNFNVEYTLSDGIKDLIQIYNRD